MPKLLIQLTPLDTFFFGGETTFGEGLGANYFAKSNIFPQQTTLLGLVRHELLIQNDALDKVKEKGEILIGLSSFDPSVPNQKFGAIERISPVFMLKEDKNYFVRSREFVGEGEALQLTLVGGSAQLNNFGIKKIPLLKKLKNDEVYNPKEYFTEQLVSGESIEIDTVFKKNHKVGITKYKNGMPKPTKENRTPDNSLGFYKQISYKLAQGWSFAFYLELNTNVTFNSAIVKMGGEGRPFKMMVSDAKDLDWDKFGEKYLESAPPRYPTKNKIVLLSDAFVNSDIYNQTIFTIADVVSFRNIKTQVLHTTHWSDLRNTDKVEEINKPQKMAEKYLLLRRGAVLFTDNLSDLKIDLETPHFQKIGYNIFKTY